MVGRRFRGYGAPPNLFPPCWPMCGDLWPSCGLGDICTPPGGQAVCWPLCAPVAAMQIAPVFTKIKTPSR